MGNIKVFVHDGGVPVYQATVEVIGVGLWGFVESRLAMGDTGSDGYVTLDYGPTPNRTHTVKASKGGKADRATFQTDLFGNPTVPEVRLELRVAKALGGAAEDVFKSLTGFLSWTILPFVIVIAIILIVLAYIGFKLPHTKKGEP